MIDAKQLRDLPSHRREQLLRRDRARDESRDPPQRRLLVRYPAVAGFAHPQAFLGALARPDLVPQLAVPPHHDQEERSGRERGRRVVYPRQRRCEQHRDRCGARQRGNPYGYPPRAASGSGAPGSTQIAAAMSSVAAGHWISVKVRTASVMPNAAPRPEPTASNANPAVSATHASRDCPAATVAAPATSSTRMTKPIGSAS